MGLPEGVDAIRGTLREMVRMTRAGQRSVPVITFARDVLAKNLPNTGTAKDYAAQVRTLQHFVRDEVRYIRDPIGAEMVQTPERTLSIRAGDCDDKSVLLASLLASIGVPVRFVAIGVNGGPYSHVLVEAKLGSRWIPCETIVANKEPGWFPPDVTRVMRAHV